MIRLSLCSFALVALLVGPVMAQEMPVPSGMATQFVEVVLEPDTGFARFRFVAPDLGQLGSELSDISDDFVWLCEHMALPALIQTGWEAQQIVISIADRPLAFGETSPGAVQYFDGFSISGSSCLWEPF